MDSTLLPDTVRTKALLERIAEEREWSNDNVEGDLAILEKNRLLYVRDLRSLSKESWAVIELLPIVKDLLRNAIDPEWSLKYDEHEQKSMNGGKKGANNKKKNKNKDEYSSDNDDLDNKKKDKKKNGKKEKKEKKAKGFISASTLGTPVVPTVLTKLSEEPSSLIENTPAPDTLGEILSDDRLTIQNTIRNGSTSLDDNSSSSNISNDGDDDDDDDDGDDDIPISPNGTRRKSVTFSNETAVGIAASEKTENNKKDKKKDKKDKKDKKNKKNKDKMASISNINGVHNFTNHPIVKFKKMKKKNCRKLPPVPANDLFLQNLYNKLIFASGQSI
ncbi:hypothetical protein K501DRAFT_337048 [Backusella circina FSU 941]|nr:hypothetical protein K501DRAFT_337048 [Backusella circina FSU 941]